MATRQVNGLIHHRIINVMIQIATHNHETDDEKFDDEIQVGSYERWITDNWFNKKFK